MDERHEPTSRHLKRISKFETEILPSRLEKKNFAQRLDELERAFGPALHALLTTPPNRSVGSWRPSTDAEAKRAAHLMLGRVLIFARHDKEKEGSAQSARAGLRRLTETLEKARDAFELDKFARRYLRQRAPGFHSRLDDLATALGNVANVVGEFTSEFPTEKRRGIVPSARNTVDLLLVLYVQTTGVYPALAPSSSWPIASAEGRGDFALIKPPPLNQAAWSHDNTPPLTRIVQCAVSAATDGVAKYSNRASKLSANLFETRFTRMRKLTLIGGD